MGRSLITIFNSFLFRISHDLFPCSFKHDVQLALECFNSGSSDLPQLVKFTDYLKLMECNVEHPNSDFIVCQQVISQCFALKSNVMFR